MTELQLLEQIAKNTTDIKAFCYALAVGLSACVTLFVFNWIVKYVVGSRY